MTYLTMNVPIKLSSLHKRNICLQFIKQNDEKWLLLILDWATLNPKPNEDR